jgi:predicted enzyme related to lactoylglutathione lyase
LRPRAKPRPRCQAAWPPSGFEEDFLLLASGLAQFYEPGPVESVEASHGDLKARGCTFTAAPHEVTTGMWAATFTDPDGHKLTILGGR